MKKAKTDLLRAIQHAFKKAFEQNHPELTDEKARQDRSRRQFLKKTMVGATALVASKALSGTNYITRFAAPEQKFSVGILGGGVAGLHAAYILQKANIESTIFEASNRTGGRMYTAKNMLGRGITTELGGEFVDSNHKDILDLAAEFGLELVDTEKDSHLVKQIFHFNGEKYDASDLVKALQPFVDDIKADIDSLPDEITYRSFGDAKKWDDMSIAAYLHLKGIRGWLKNMLNVAFTTEYGLDIADQSAINLLFLFDPENAGEELFGESDERYKIKGGNQRITDELTRRIKNIRKDHEATRISSPGKRFEVQFSNGKSEAFDYLICTIPFTKLRTIDLEVTGLTDIKKKCIAELGYGKNAKMFAGFKKRFWRDQGSSGQVFSDQPFQLGWDSSQLQKGKAGGYTFLTGGSMSDKMIDTEVPKKVNEYISQIEAVFPGVKEQFTGKGAIFFWPQHKFTLASYACYRPGQWTTIGGAEIEPVGNMLFAGEHCSSDFQGYMNGGAETGRRAAEELIVRVRAAKA